MLPELLQIESQVSARDSLKRQLSIPHESEGIGGIILDLKILGANLFHTGYIDR